MTNFRNELQIGSDVDFIRLPMDVTIRRYCLLKKMWKLNSEEITWVTAIYLKKTTVKKLLELLNEEHPWKDRVEYNSKLYDLEFLDCSISWMMEKENKQKELIISVRENAPMNFYCFLVRTAEGMKERVSANTREL